MLVATAISPSYGRVLEPAEADAGARARAGVLGGGHEPVQAPTRASLAGLPGLLRSREAPCGFSFFARFGGGSAFDQRRRRRPGASAPSSPAARAAPAKLATATGSPTGVHGRADQSAAAAARDAR